MYVLCISAFQLFIKGGFFMYPLAACSIIAVAIICERFMALRRSRIIPPAFMAGLNGIYRERSSDREAAMMYCKAHDAPLSRIVSAGIKRLPRGVEAMERAMEESANDEAVKLRANMRFLYAIGSVATLLGLIGTISGMIKAFQVAAVGGIGRVEQLSTGIYEAMVNTFGGLAVAIIVTAFYYFLLGRIERRTVEINAELEQFADHYGLHEADDERPVRIAAAS